MHYLIDGHNLIAKMANIDLGEENDEAKLVLVLKGWAAGRRQRQLTVYFDGGLPGGLSVNMSSGPVTVVFATSGRSADNLLIRAIRGVKNPPEYILVTSDQKIIQVAKGRKMAYIPSELFARQMSEERESRLRPPAPLAEEPTLTPQEVAEWLERFGPVVELPPPPPIPTLTPLTLPPAPPPAKRSAAELKASGSRLRPDEVSEWLEMFGAVPPRPGQSQSPSSTPPVQQPADKATSRPGKGLKNGEGNLNEDEVNEWLTMFTRPGDKTHHS